LHGPIWIAVCIGSKVSRRGAEMNGAVNMSLTKKVIAGAILIGAVLSVTAAGCGETATPTTSVNTTTM
jgi:hypothetical protein